MGGPMTGPIEVEECGDFWRLWLREREYFNKMCLRWLRGNRHDAEDVLSKAALNAVVYMRHNPQVIQRFRPWMLRVLSNLCTDILRARLRGLAFERGTRRPSPWCWSAGPTVRCPTTRSCAGRSPRRSSRPRAVLPPHLYEVFALRFLEELPYDRISEALMITPQNARKRIQQVREILREELRAFA
jgi:DNA-directed RNA polymerase specialized sigma24 family protein